MSISQLTRIHRNLFTGALLAAGLVACATEDSTDPDEDPIGRPGAGAPDPDVIAANRKLDPGTPVTIDPAFQARMQGQVDRAQTYLDEHVVPEFDRALRETSGVSYETLKAEAAAAMHAPDPKAAIEQFVTQRKPIVDAALAQLGTTTEQLGEQIKGAALAGDQPLPDTQPLPTHRGICAPGFEFEPFPPYFQAGTFSSGTNTNSFSNAAAVNGLITASAGSIGGWGNGGGWIRAENIPPAGAGFSTVMATVSFSTMSAEMLLYFPAWAGAGVGVTLEVHDGSPSGPLLANCRQALLDRSLPIGYLFDNRPMVAFPSCTFHHGQLGTGLLSTRVLVDAYATSAALVWGGFAQANASAFVASVRYNTCTD